MHNLIAIVLGGGAGSRLFPLTANHAKPAIPMLGKYRLVDVPISNCLNAGIDRVFVLTQFNAASLNNHLADTYRFGAFSRGFVSVLAAEQTPTSSAWYRGTADAVRQVLPYLDRHPFTHALILSGDQLYRMDFEAVYRHHLERGAALTIVSTPVTRDEAPRLGILKTGPADAITHFSEKPGACELPGLESEVGAAMAAQGRRFLASTGIYLFNREVLRSALLDHPSFTDFGKEVIPHTLLHREVVSYPFEGYWSDVGTIGSYHEANLAFARREAAFDLYRSAGALFTRSAVLPPPAVHDSYVDDALIAEGCLVLGSRISNAVLGPRSYVGPGSVVQDTVMLGADYYQGDAPSERPFLDGPDRPGVGAGCYLRGVVVGANASIGDGCRLINTEGVQEGEGANYYIRDGLIVIPGNAELPAGTTIGTPPRKRRAGVGPGSPQVASVLNETYASTFYG